MNRSNLSILIIAGFASCASLKSIPETENRIPLSNLSGLNGVYALTPDSAAKPTLDFCLTFDEYFNYKNPPRSTDKVRLEANGNKRLLVSTYRGDTLIQTRTVKGKVENNYFKMNQFRFSPFWLIINRTKIKKTRMGLLPDGNLVVDERYDLTGYFLFMPFGGVSDKNVGMVYKKK